MYSDGVWSGSIRISEVLLYCKKSETMTDVSDAKKLVASSPIQMLRSFLRMKSLRCTLQSVHDLGLKVICT